MRLSIFVVLLLHTFTSISGQNQLKFSLKDCILDRTTTNFMKVYSSDTIKNVIKLYEAFEREMINAEILNNNSKKGYIKLLNNFASFDFSQCEFIQTHSFLGAMFVVPVLNDCEIELINNENRNYREVLILNQLQATGYDEKTVLKYVKKRQKRDFLNIEFRSGTIALLMFKIHHGHSINGFR